MGSRIISACSISGMATSCAAEMTNSAMVRPRSPAARLSMACRARLILASSRAVDLVVAIVVSCCCHCAVLETDWVRLPVTSACRDFAGRNAVFCSAINDVQRLNESGFPSSSKKIRRGTFCHAHARETLLLKSLKFREWESAAPDYAPRLASNERFETMPSPIQELQSSSSIAFKSAMASRSRPSCFSA